VEISVDLVMEFKVDFEEEQNIPKNYRLASRGSLRIQLTEYNTWRVVFTKNKKRLRKHFKTKEQAEQYAEQLLFGTY
jgi:hypothetical protein